MVRCKLKFCPNLCFEKQQLHFRDWSFLCWRSLALVVYCSHVLFGHPVCPQEMDGQSSTIRIESWFWSRGYSSYWDGTLLGDLSGQTKIYQGSHTKRIILQSPLIAWNGILAIFSSISFYVCLMEFLAVYERLYHNFIQLQFKNSFFSDGFSSTYCKTNGYFDGRIGFIQFLFTLSKVSKFSRKSPFQFSRLSNLATRSSSSCANVR